MPDGSRSKNNLDCCSGYATSLSSTNSYNEGLGYICLPATKNCYTVLEAVPESKRCCEGLTDIKVSIPVNELGDTTDVRFCILKASLQNKG